MSGLAVIGIIAGACLLAILLLAIYGAARNGSQQDKAAEAAIAQWVTDVTAAKNDGEVLRAGYPAYAFAFVEDTPAIIEARRRWIRAELNLKIASLQFYYTSSNPMDRLTAMIVCVEEDISFDVALGIENREELMNGFYSALDDIVLEGMLLNQTMMRQYVALCSRFEDNLDDVVAQHFEHYQAVATV